MPKLDDYDPTLDGFPKPLDVLAMNEGTIPAFTKAEAAAFIGVPAEQYTVAEHFPKFLAAWRYKMAAEMLEARKKYQ